MVNVNKLSEVGKKLETVINAANISSVRRVWLNLEGMVPETPAILVEPQNITRERYATGHQTLNTFTVHLTVLHSRIASETDTNQECLQIAENLEGTLHDNMTLDGLMVHSMVSSLELGVATRQKIALRAARLVWQGVSRTRLQ